MAGPTDLYPERTFDFLERLRACADAMEIAQAIVQEMGAFGFECVTCWTLPPPGQSPIEGVMLNTRPEEYIERYVEQNYVVRDPVIKHLGKETRPFSWTDVKKRDALSKADTDIIDEAREFRVNDGLVVPIITISGSIALFSPCGDKPDLSPRARLAVEVMGIMALQTLKRATLDKLREEPDYKPLTPREREVMQWVAHGKSDDEIGEILSISESTVLQHVENAKRKLDAYKRTSAIITALRRGEISL
jgi:LuxR family transcriptional regulator, quorum-sensing system regulator BjaR1